MMVKTFGSSDLADGAGVGLGCFFGVFDDTGAFNKVINPKRRKESRRAIGGQNMIGASEVIAHRLAAPRADEDRASVLNLLR